MSDKNYDLPGFYRDPKTGKYFRDNPAAAKNRSLEKLKKENENQSKILKKSTYCSKHANILKFLLSREIGPLSGVLSEKDYCRMVTSNMKMTNEYNSENIVREAYQVQENSMKVDYVRGTPSFVLGICTVRDKAKSEICMIGHQPLALNHGIFYDIISFPSITDLCEGPNSTIIYIYNYPRIPGHAEFRLGEVMQLIPNSEADVELPSDLNHLISTKDPVFCCSSTIDRSHVAIGLSKSVLLFRPNHNGRMFPVYNAARVHTISFSHSSNLMVIGLHTGHLSVKDLRSENYVSNLKISDYCINESYFLEPDKVIVAGLENVLCKVDLRMNGVVTEYFDHKTSTRKSALSIASNMVCATGADNITRIWHLSGGEPVYKMNPHLSLDNSIKGWLFNEADKTYLYHFEAGVRKTYLLT